MYYSDLLRDNNRAYHHTSSPLFLSISHISTPPFLFDSFSSLSFYFLDSLSSPFSFHNTTFHHILHFIPSSFNQSLPLFLSSIRSFTFISPHSFITHHSLNPSFIYIHLTPINQSINQSIIHSFIHPSIHSSNNSSNHPSLHPPRCSTAPSAGCVSRTSPASHSGAPSRGRGVGGE